MCCSTGPASSRWSTTPPIGSIGWPRSLSARRRPSGRSRSSSSVLRTNPDMAAERERVAPYLAAEPHKTVAFIAEMDMDAPEGDGPVVYTCPMHPEVVDEEPGHCPQCGMKLLAVEAPATTYTCPMHPQVVSEQPGHCPDCRM